ncbi:phenylalanine--tRNA ligase alpha subunit, cytoplasmic-like protein [Tanacetum coccineum]
MQNTTVGDRATKAASWTSVRDCDCNTIAVAEEAVLDYLKHKGPINDAGEFAVEKGISHDVIVNVIKSLNGHKSVIAQFYTWMILCFMGYGDYVIDLEVSFRKHTCFVRDLDGVDLILNDKSGTNFIPPDLLKHLTVVSYPFALTLLKPRPNSGYWQSLA